MMVLVLVLALGLSCNKSTASRREVGHRSSRLSTMR
jgi:hypothetical protein